MGSSSSKTIYYPEFEAKLPSLQGKTVLITGCTSGTGLIAAKCAVRKGADAVILLNRASARATAAEETVKAEIPSGSATVVETIPCDLMDCASVRQAADTVKQKYTKLNVLCNNAGVMALEDKATVDGYDIQMQTNHLSHFILTKELFPLLKAATGGARIVHHTSLARHGVPLEAKYFGKNGGNLGGNSSSMLFGGAKWVRYHHSKLANAVMTQALAEKLKGTNVIAACAHPGLASTNLSTTTAETGGMGWDGWMMHFAQQSAEDGTMPLLAACFSPDTVNGDCWGPKKNFTGVAVKIEVDKNSKDVKQQKLLWEQSEEACGKFDI